MPRLPDAVTVPPEMLVMALLFPFRTRLPPESVVNVTPPFAVSVPLETLVTILLFPLSVTVPPVREFNVKAPPTVVDPAPARVPRFAAPVNSTIAPEATLKSLPDFREPEMVKEPDVTEVPPVYVLEPSNEVTPDEVRAAFPANTAETLPEERVIEPFEVKTPVPVTFPLMVAEATVWVEVPIANVAPVSTVSAPLPMLLLAVVDNVPPITCVVPVIVFAPPRVTFPVDETAPVVVTFADTFAPPRTKAPEPRANVPEPKMAPSTVADETVCMVVPRERVVPLAKVRLPAPNALLA
jgi:hypothetical protein